MKNLKKLLDQADDSIFDEIIKGCEGKMTQPFKKEKTVIAVEAEPEDETETMEEGGEEESDSKLADLSPEDIAKLKELYAQIKG
jgi:hypothetical protein